MIETKRKELEIDHDLKKKIEIISSFSNQTPIFKNGSVIKIERTNIAYIEPHTVIINNKRFLFFNNRDDIFLETLNNAFKLKDLEFLIKKKKL